MEGLPVNIADIGILAILLISGVFAFVRGFVHELLAVIAWVGAAAATLYGIDLATPFARQLTTMQPVADIGAGVVIFLVVLVVLTILTRMVSKRVQASSLSTLDRSLGLLFGILRGVARIRTLLAMRRGDRDQVTTDLAGGVAASRLAGSRPRCGRCAGGDHARLAARRPDGPALGRS